MTQDRVVKGASDGRLYRVIAGEAHSWSFLLIEDQLGERFRIDTRSHALSPVSDDVVDKLMETRAFRPWSGSRNWASLSDLAATRADGRRSDPSGRAITHEPSVDVLADA